MPDIEATGRNRSEEVIACDLTIPTRRPIVFDWVGLLPRVFIVRHVLLHCPALRSARPELFGLVTTLFELIGAYASPLTSRLSFHSLFWILPSFVVYSAVVSSV